MWMHRLVAAVATFCIACAAWGQCSPRLVEGYDYGRLKLNGTGVNNAVFCGAVFDDHSGTGPCLFVGGTLTVLGNGGGSWLAKLVGDHWEAVAGFNGAVRCLGVIDDGSGPVLYIGGSFTSNPSGGSGALVKWDGQNWTDLGVSCAGGLGGVFCVTQFDEGAGPVLFAGDRKSVV